MLLAFARPAAAAEDDAGRFFRDKIEPVLQADCYKCHSAKAEKVKGGLLLDTRAGMLKGGDTGPAIVPGKSKESLLLQAIRHEGDLEMPPKKPQLSAQVIADFAKWVDAGATVPGTTTAAESEPDPRRHWAFQPVKKPAPPAVGAGEWVRNPVDSFVLAKLEAKGWQFAPPAGKGELIRRVTFDLTGLPPSPEEVGAFENDASADAYEKVVDRLLASPRYGERWAQHWLDVVRYAESEGYEYDRHLPDAWRYRDYVIDSLNRDKPFARFVAEQIAGDEIEPGNTECLVASTFHRLGPVRRNAGNPDIALSRNEVLTERTDVIGAAFLGMTVGCARCHNHKLEPIPQKDYYRLQAYLAATDEHNIVLATDAEQKEWAAKARQPKADILRLQRMVKTAQGDERVKLNAQIEALEDQIPPPLATIPATWDDPKQRTEIHVLKRGVWENKAEAVGPRPPSILVSDDLPELPADAPHPRAELAKWLTDPAHPLTGRVIVNRLWQQHFGTGLVKTVNDFGLKGDPPSHPDLIDWLASTLVENGWHLKPIHRLIVLSGTYRQSSRSPLADAASRSDPDNRLVWHFNRRRLTGEEIRDAMLAASGRLNPAAGGPSVMVPVDPDLVKQLYKPDQWQVARNKAEYDRRSVYLIAKRNLRLPFMEAFDAPPLLTSCPRRESSTHAPQALEMLNGPLSNDLAAAFARRLQSETDGSPDQIADRAYRLATGRAPTDAERRLAAAYLRDGSPKEFALAVFNLNGFFYVP